jgi:nucleoid DNA-binding protein
MGNKLLLQDLIDRLSESGKLKKKDAEQFLRAFFKVVEESLFQGEIVKIQGLGTFKLLKVDARKSVSVSTGEEFQIEEHYKISFIPESSLRELINKPFSHLEPVDLGLLAENMGLLTEMGQIYKTDFSEERLKEKHRDREHLPDNKSKKAEPNTVKGEEIDLDKKNIENKTVQSVPDLEELPEEFAGSSRHRTIIIWAVFALIAVSLAIWAYLSNSAAKRDELFKEEAIEAYEKNQKENAVQMDTSAGFVQDSLINDSITKAKKNVEEQEKTEVTVQKPSKHKIKTSGTVVRVSNQADITTETMEQGSRLTLMALKYYGNKVFWVYIYEANKDKITDPNNIPVGTKIRIPKPDSSKINARDSECIEKAKSLQTRILSK